VVPLSRYLVYVLITTVGCALDLATKHWMLDWLEAGTGQIHWIWKGVFGFQAVYNRGALFGMGQGMWPVFTTLSFAAAAGILAWLFVFKAAKDWWLTLALSLISGGILGNLYDRLGLPGIIDPLTGERMHVVRDFILMQLNDRYQWPNYNIADSLLVCGAAILFCHAIFVKPADQAATAGNANRAAPGEQREAKPLRAESEGNRSV
jgi:signal peptidase II